MCFVISIFRVKCIFGTVKLKFFDFVAARNLSVLSPKNLQKLCAFSPDNLIRVW